MSAYSDLVLAHPDLAVFYRLGESSGTTLTDTEAGVNGTLGSGLTYSVAGAIANDANTAQTSDASADWGTVNDHAALHLGNGPFSIEFWVKRSATQGATQVLINNGTGAPQLRFTAANRIALFKEGTAGALLSTSAITDTAAYHHIVVTKDGNPRNFYVDGVLDNSLVGTTQTMVDGTGLQIGHAASASRFPGSLDEIAVYKAVLSAAEVLAHYRLGKGLIGHASETDTAVAFDADKRATLGVASESDSAQAFVFTKTIRKTLTPATESDTAQALSHVKPIYKSLTPATESDAAQALDADRAKSLTSASETDSAQSLAVTKTIHQSITPANESDVAQDLSVTRTIYRSLTPATETDEAQALTVATPSTETGGGWIDIGRRVIRPKKPQVVMILPAEEHDEATPLTYTKQPSRIQIEDDELLLLV